MARVERFKWIQRNEGKGPNELYDLSSDPQERNNQADNEQYTVVKNELGAEIVKWKSGEQALPAKKPSKKKGK
jgi:hypothetical protein